jgi:hypothetical protein
MGLRKWVKRQVKKFRHYRANRKYMETGDCPACGYPDLFSEYGDGKENEWLIWNYVQCQSCGAEWRVAWKKVYLGFEDLEIDEEAWDENENKG